MMSVFVGVLIKTQVLKPIILLPKLGAEMLIKIKNSKPNSITYKVVRK